MRLSEREQRPVQEVMGEWLDDCAILWATTRLNSETLHLRCDAAALLMEGRQYADPNPTHLTPQQRELLSAGAAQQGATSLHLPALNATRQFADGSMAVTVHFKPDAAKLLEAGCKIDRKTPLQWVYDSATADLVSTLRENFPGWPAREEDELEAIFDASNPEAVDEERRLEEEAKAEELSSDDALMVAAVVPYTPETLRLPASGPIRLSLDVPPTEKRCGLSFDLDYDEQEAERIRSLARVFGLSAKAFLLQLLTRQLPGQPRTQGKLAEAMQASHVAFACFDAAMLARLERAARHEEKTVDEFVAYALASHVDCAEEEMLTHPHPA